MVIGLCSSWNEHRSSLSTSGSRGRTCQCCPFRRTRTRPRTEVNVRPPTADHFRPPKPGPLHQNDRRPLVPYRGLTNLHKLVKARPVYIRLPLRWPPHLPGRVRVDQLLGFCPRKERVKNRNHVRAGRCTSLTPMLGDEGPQLASRQVGDRYLRVSLCELPQDPPIRIERARCRVALQLTPVEKRIDCPFDPHGSECRTIV